MLDTTTNAAAVLPQQVAAHAYHFAPTPSGSRPVWCVVAAQPKAERIANAELHRRGFEAYLPLLTVRRPNRHYHIGPLFPGYLFCRLRLDQPWNPVRLCPGVFSLLSVNGIPSICPEAVVEALRAGEAVRSIPATPDNLYRPGAPCEAILGGGSKVDAVVMAVDGQKARVLSLMFGQIREMTIAVDNLRLRDQ